MAYTVPLRSVSRCGSVRSMRRVMEYVFRRGLCFRVIVVFLFLQSWRATLVPVLAIRFPHRYVYFLPLLGFKRSIHLTLFGSVLAIGIG